METKMLILVIGIIAVAVTFIALFLMEHNRNRKLKDDVQILNIQIEGLRQLHLSATERLKEKERMSEFVNVEYYESESDHLKYKSERAKEKAIKDILAMRLGYDIAKKLGNAPYREQVGKNQFRYSYMVKIEKP